jgi:hypothetical protein
VIVNDVSGNGARDTPLQIPHKSRRRSSPTKGFGEWELFTKQDGQLAQFHEQNHNDSDVIDSSRGKNQTIMFIQMFV